MPSNAKILDRVGALVPSLSKETVLTTWAGLRPMRAGGVRLEVEHLDGFPIVHNFGHGGGGVTTCWGCASVVADLIVGLRD